MYPSLYPYLSRGIWRTGANMSIREGRGKGQNCRGRERQRMRAGDHGADTPSASAVVTGAAPCDRLGAARGLTFESSIAFHAPHGTVWALAASNRRRNPGYAE